MACARAISYPQIYIDDVRLGLSDYRFVDSSVEERLIVDAYELIREKGRVEIEEEFDEQFRLLQYPKPIKEYAKILIKNIKIKPKKWFPPLEWLPQYHLSYLLTDIIAGITISLLSIPQGMAYASLAGVPAIIGLYTSFLPPMLYAPLGSSKHMIIGLIAVICMMIGSAQQSLGHDISRNATKVAPGIDLWSLETVKTASSLTIMTGLVFMVMFVFQLHHVTTYLSDQVTRAFITGSAIHILWSQIPALFGVKSAQSFTGFLKLYYVIKDFVLHVHSFSVADTILSISCMIPLYIGNTYINPWIVQKFNIPFPFELLIVVISTFLSAYLKFESKYHVEVIGHLPTGFPKLHVPSINNNLWVTSIILAVLVYCVVFSGEKVIAKKHGYKISAKTELRALSVTYIISSFFMCIPACGGLVRIAVSSQMGSRSQITGITSSAIILILVLWLGPLIENLPMCVLSGIIVVALKGMLMQIMDVFTLWKTSKIDLIIWVFTFIITVIWDVSEGLIGSIGFSLFTVILRTQWSKSSTLEQIEGFEIYAPKREYKPHHTPYNICIYRFNGPLLFLNAETFHKQALKCFKKKFSDLYDVTSSEKHQNEKFYLILDFSGITDVDQSGANAMKNLNEEIKKSNGILLVANSQEYVRHKFEKNGLYSFVPMTSFFPTIQDAFAYVKIYAMERRKSTFLEAINNRF